MRVQEVYRTLCLIIKSSSCSMKKELNFSISLFNKYTNLASVFPNSNDLFNRVGDEEISLTSLFSFLYDKNLSCQPGNVSSICCFNRFPNFIGIHKNEKTMRHRKKEEKKYKRKTWDIFFCN